MDIKNAWFTGTAKRNRWQNLESIEKKDQIKFVICSEEDYLWSKQQLEETPVKYIM